ncbi:phytoene desaturase family protein [Pseudonocardia spinosispora]|uniref:phytoene desaturase family protein n=1 Tax=Pseudonocardia spinosispora TaxID=103441 RepID=UPI00048F3149|nr:phytoene desaturase family protein [Pseudonocardia spinosispora]
MRTVSGPTDHVVVVGTGLAGLATALYLLGAGRRVTLVERAAHPGGRAGRTDMAGPAGTYLVDTGPTVLTMPDLVDAALGQVGEKLTDRLELVRLDPAYRAHFADGSTIDVHTDADAMETEIAERVGPSDAAGYRRLRRWLTALYRAEIDTFIGSNMDSPFSLLSPDLARLAALGGFGRLGPRIGGFVEDERLRRLFSFQALYAGVAPARALAAYGVIAYMDTIAGVWFPKGGMRALPTALADAAVSAGATIRYRTEVTGLVRRGDRATGVRVLDESSSPDRIDADAVVLTPDLPVVHRLLGRRPRRPVPLRWAPSAVVVHAGGPMPSGTAAELAHHTLSFGAAWSGTFDEILRDGRLMSDPSLLLTRPTATDPSLAPAGHQLYYLLAPCPNTATAALDWPRIGPAYADELLGVLDARGFTGLSASVETSRLVTPADWAEEGMAAGTPFSAAHTFAQTGPFRPRNLPSGWSNVVLAGCGTTPGVGIPPVLISGRLAAQRITG